MRSSGAIVCTFTNSRLGTTLTLNKSWQNAIVGNAVTVSTAGATNNASLNSTANTATETDNGTAVNGFAGEQITISEAFTTGSSANYTSTLACSGNANALAGNQHICQNLDFIGIDSPGALQQLWTVPAGVVVPLSPAVPLRHGG